MLNECAIQTVVDNDVKHAYNVIQSDPTDYFWRGMKHFFIM